MNAEQQQQQCCCSSHHSSLPPVRRMTYTMPEAMIILGIGKTQAYRLVAENNFPVAVFKVGDAYRVSAEALDALVAGKTVQTDGDGE